MLVELKDIKKTYPLKAKSKETNSRFFNAVDGVDLAIAKNECLGLVGESGCGKTTLARIMLRLVSCNGGKVIFDGNDITKTPNFMLKPFRKQAQMVFQDPYSSLDPRFTVRNILKEGLALHATKYKKQGEQEIHFSQLLERVGLEPGVLIRYPHEFSGGERQRIAIARALVMSPKFLVLDEAVSSLDVLIQQQMVDLLKKLKKEMDLTYLFVTHNLRIVKKIADKIVVMYKGRIVEMAPAGEIFSNPLNPYTKELLSAAVEYKSVRRDKPLAFDLHSPLVDQGNGHWARL